MLHKTINFSHKFNNNLLRKLHEDDLLDFKLVISNFILPTFVTLYYVYSNDKANLIRSSSRFLKLV